MYMYQFTTSKNLPFLVNISVTYILEVSLRKLSKDLATLFSTFKESVNVFAKIVIMKLTPSTSLPRIP
jgi:hypothetical protein